jgi:dipeptidyl aminopeptidase/acylaminoacyl peptidase
MSTRIAWSTGAAVALATSTMVSVDERRPGPAPRPAFTLHQITQVHTIGDMAISRDGRWLAYALGGHYFEFPVVPRFGEENNLRLIDVATGEIRRLTSGPQAKTNPVFSPAGDRLAFESEDDIWTVRLADGATARVTDHAARDSSPSWSPDGRRIVFVSSRGGRSDLWSADADGEQYGLERITNDPLGKQDPQWSPDGRAIAYTGKRSDEHYSQGIFTVAAGGGMPRRLTPEDGFDHSTARWSPDGRRLAFISDRHGYLRVWVMDRDGGRAIEFDTGPHDVAAAYWTVQPVWSPAGRHILVSLNREGSYDLLRLSLDHLRVETIASGGGQYHEVGWTADGGIAYVYENAWSPPDVFVRSSDAAPPRQLTFSSHVAFRREHFAEMSRVRFLSTDGLQIPAMLLMPPARERSGRLPAVVALHPNAYGQFTDRWSPFFHYVARSGYIVLLVDQRGSSGYGRAFREAQIGAWGTGTVEDVRAAAVFLRTHPAVDPERLGVMGMSFGGYNALLAVLREPRLFRAGIVLMGPTERRGTFTDAYRAFQIGATEAENPDLYRRISPVALAGNLEAPLLIIHSDRDRNVAPEHTYRLTAELDRHGKPYELRMYLGEAHGLADPDRQLDSYERMVAFLDRYLK